jgi:D-amino-acid dehydrogenase
VASRVIIIGGGIVGLSTAYALHARGVESIVLDREPLGESASFGNAGLIVYGHAPINKPGVVRDGVKMLLDRQSPLYIKPRLSGTLAAWLWAFTRSCNQSHVEKAIGVVGELGWLARETFQAMIDKTAISCNWKTNGWVELCATDRSLAHATTESEALAPYGYTALPLVGRAFHDTFEGFTPSVFGAVHHTDSASIDPRAFMGGLHGYLTQNGVDVRCDANVSDVVVERGRVRGVELDSGERLDGDTVVLAAGVWSSTLAKRLGLSLPMQPARGYHRDYETTEHTPSIGGVIRDTAIAFTPMHDRFRIAGTLELAGFDQPWIPRRLNAITTGAAAMISAVTSSRESADWAGYRPCTPDGLPAVGPVSSIDGLFVSTGHAMMGMTLGPVSGRIIAEQICSVPPSFDHSMLAVERFA